MSDQAAALRLIARRRPAEQAYAPQRVVAVGSGKGGVGKSNIALNLAIELSGRGRPTCLFDADLGLANACILAGVTPRLTLAHILKGDRSVDEIVTPGPMGLGIIAGLNGVAEMANMTREQRMRIQRALDGFGREWDYLVIDTGAGIAQNVIAFLERSDHAIAVLTPEPTSMADAFGLIKALVERHYDGRISVVVNRAATIQEAREAANKMVAVVRQYLHREVDWAGFLLEDPAVTKAVKSRTPFVTVSRSSRAARSVALLADKVEAAWRSAETVGAGASAGRVRGWFERLFG
jgi:flagellar biosynthesis protein FlhG